MTDHSQAGASGGPSHRSVELTVAALMIVFGAVVVFGSLQVGVGWGVEGPRAGFFPFYIGLIITAASVFNVVQALPGSSRGRVFASWAQLRQVLSVVIPTGIYVFVIPVVGIYLSSMVLIGLFMRWLGRYSWPLVLAIAIGVPLVFYFMFERWFLVPLPKGPIEDWLHL